MRLLREPMVHFLALGALLFGLWTWTHRGKDISGESQTPERLASPTRKSRTVTVGEADVGAMRASFRAAWKREPSAAELGDLLQVFIGEEVLFRHAQALGLDRDDRVVRRRLIEKMTTLVRPNPPSSDPPRDELLRWYGLYAHRFARPATASFAHLFFDPKRRSDASADATQAMSLLRNATPNDPPAAGTGDPFVLPLQLKGKSEMELAHLLGEGFATSVMALPVGQWRGPLTSKFGVHLIRVTERQPQRLPPFDEVEKYVRADWLTVETRGLRGAAEKLLPEYEIVLPDDIRRQVEGEPALAPVLRRAR
ncbi:MAG: peptidyl-prolyl cis-trans isomerase [Deltaproteobacteria bacterium]|nr:peptidyl-prolyl cis-trans isomerase [Deltaproteobacteria bacterium]